MGTPAMESLKNFINFTCADKTSDLEFAVVQLECAIRSIQSEKIKRRKKENEKLVKNFEEAFKALVDANVIITLNSNSSLFSRGNLYEIAKEKGFKFYDDATGEVIKND